MLLITKDDVVRLFVKLAPLTALALKTRGVAADGRIIGARPVRGIPVSARDSVHVSVPAIAFQPSRARGREEREEIFANPNGSEKLNRCRRLRRVLGGSWSQF